MTDTLAYIRVSTEQQATEQKTSLGEQRKAIESKARQLGRVITDEAVFVDPGVSGATAEGRPGFMAMLAYCQSNPRSSSAAGVILVLNNSRFGRFDDPEESTYWRVTLKRLGWIVRFCEGDDMEDGIGRSVMMVVNASAATEYRQNLRRTARTASRATAEKGRWGCEAPLGYRRLATRPDGSQRVLDLRQRKADDEVVRLTRGPETECIAVEFAFRTYAEGGISMGKLARVMEERFPFRRWSTTTVHAMLRNPAYVGDVTWGRRPMVGYKRQAAPTPRSKWLVVENAHPALVTREIFEKVQQRMAGNHRERRATVGGYPLAGIVRCATCGLHFAGGGGPKGPADDPDKFRFYVDTGARQREPVCPPPITTLRKQWLESTVIDAVAKMVSDPRAQRAIDRAVKRVMLTMGDVNGERRALLTKERDRTIAQRQRLVAAVASGTVTESEAASSMTEVRARIAALDSELEQVRFQERRTTNMDLECARLVKLAQDFPAQAKRLTGSALRDVLKPWIADAVVDKKERTLTLTLWRIPDAMNVLQMNDSLRPIAGRTAPRSTFPSPSECSSLRASSRKTRCGT